MPTPADSPSPEPADAFWHSDGLDPWFLQAKSYPVPAWNERGYLPPFRPGSLDLPAPEEYQRRPLESKVAPYRVTVAYFVEHFGFNAHRRRLLAGWFDYRARLHALGLRSGWHWVGGSFVDAKPEPRDIDQATFMDPNGAWPGLTPARRDAAMVANRELFHPAEAKARYGVDGRFVLLALHPWVFRMSAAFQAMYGHDKAGTWKGFVEVDLAPDPNEASLRSSLGETRTP
jgi:hypothetical protein